MQFFQINTIEQASELKFPRVVSVDTEYSELDVKKAKLLSIIVGTDENTAYEIKPELISYLTQLKQSELIYFQNFVVDHYMLNKYGLDLSSTPLFDCMLADHLIDERREHGLDAMVKREYGDNYKEGFWSKYSSFDQASPEDALAYACKDGIYTYRLGVKFKNELAGKDALLEHCQKLHQSLFETELSGVKVDIELLQKVRNDMYTKINEYLPKLRTEFNEYCQIWEFRKWNTNLGKYKTAKGRVKADKPTFSFSSDKQIAWLVYDGLGIEAGQKTKRGNPSTSFETLNDLKERHPILGTLVAYKEDKSVFSTFVEGMLERVVGDRIYPHFNVNGTATGRISHSNPNLGNLPTTGVIRNFFIPGEGMVLIGADYAQLEVNIELNLTDDPGLREIIVGGASKHDLFKIELDSAGFNLPRNEVKNVNFALQYDAQEYKISKMVGCSLEEAKRIIDIFYKKFSGVKRVKELTKKELAEHGKITNLFGRIRHFDTPKNKYEKAKQERQAYNFKIQGVAGDVCNRAFWQFRDHLKKTGTGRTLWPVHDEILAEVKEDRAEEEKQNLVRIMEEVTNYVGFKYKLQSKPYGPLKCWAKT